MNYFELKNLLGTAAVKLIRSANAPLTLGFLWLEFKEKDKISLPSLLLEEYLDDYITSLNTGDFSQKPKKYIDDWVENGFLRKLYDPLEDEFNIELTPDTEKVFKWLQDFNTQEFVGTQSRFFFVLNTLNELVYEISEDREEKLKTLYDKRDALDEEIKKVKAGLPSELDETQLKERYYLAKKQTKELLSDFQQIEHNFRQISQKIQIKYLKEQANKGEIISFTLDADEELRNTDEGKSFRAFWEFLRSAEKSNELQHTLNKLYKNQTITELEGDAQFLRKIKRYLLNSGGKIQKSIQRIGEHLRKVLDELNTDNKRVLEIINELKAVMLSETSEEDKTQTYHQLEMPPEFSFFMDRPLWKGRSSSVFEKKELSVNIGKLNKADLQKIQEYSTVDLKKLEERIASLLRYQKEVNLKEVIAKYPPEYGLEEVVWYLEIANNNRKHQIFPEFEETICYQRKNQKGESTEHKLKMPRVVFGV